MPHVFQKKSKSGIATPKLDLDLVRNRLKVAAKRAKELEDAWSSKSNSAWVRVKMSVYRWSCKCRTSDL